MASCESDKNRNACAFEDEVDVEEVEELIGCERNARVMVLGLAAGAVMS